MMRRLVTHMAALPAKVARRLNDPRETLIAARETLAAIRRGPVPWDEAAVQLDRLRRDVQRVGYPKYLYGLLSAARTARAIGAHRFTAIEFGVAGGNGLVAMEQHAATVERQGDVSIHIIGFDSGTGLPQRSDPRDCQYAFRGGEFAMDEGKLRARLHRAQLCLGDVAETVRAFAETDFPPVGFVANDLDLYTSTRDSFALFDAKPHRLLPRVTLYFDDLAGYPYTTASGEWAAIEEFNATHKDRRLGQISGLKHCLGRRYRFASWVDSFFLLHVFDHPAYNAKEATAMPVDNLRLRN
jgi:hypothetical protein